jgi:hypothetical protein
VTPGATDSDPSDSEGLEPGGEPRCQSLGFQYELGFSLSFKLARVGLVYMRAGLLSWPAIRPLLSQTHRMGFYTYDRAANLNLTQTKPETEARTE